MSQEDEISVPTKNLQTAIRKIRVAKEELANLRERLANEPDPIAAQNLSESITFMIGNIEAQDTLLRDLFDVDTIAAVRISLPEVHILQTILEELFQCSACTGRPSKGCLIVQGDLGDILAHILRNTTEVNRELLASSLNYVEILPEDIPEDVVAFPYVNYVETT